ncbi:hypothetical protein [uncultured Paraglaciecola sp.]|uniref:hypothetical protein n=1 Tax=uncultured Paraglaciecola sp. TaxID=1765024 RepID=UPI002619F3CE|nr:hypothetical protein [uncultured Paraglaciecola sp.]
MSNETYVKEAPLGQIQSGPVEIIKQVYVDTPKDLFELTLPGQITRSGSASAFAVKAIGRVVIYCGSPELGAFVSAHVSDNVGLTRAVSALLQEINPNKAMGFAVRLASRNSSFADVVAKAEAAFGSSGCGCGGNSAQLPGSVSIGLSEGSDQDMTWSKPVRAILNTQLSESGEFGPTTKECGAIALGPNTTLCTSIWHGIIDRWTECKGPCSSGDCSCGTTDGGTPKVGCDGWVSCRCQ